MVFSSDLLPKYRATALSSRCSLWRKRATSSGVSFKRDLFIRYFIPCSGAKDDMKLSGDRMACACVGW